MPSTKEVFFKDYCLVCKFADTKETEMPCDECLEYGSNTDSHKPLRYEEKE